MSLRRLGVATALVTTFAAGTAFAQSNSDPKPAPAPAQAGTPAGMKGIWVGFALFNGDQRPVKFTFDSTDAGWVGATLVPETPKSEKARAHWDKNVNIFWTTLAEDFALMESKHSTLRSGANTALTFGRFEHSAAWFHDAVDDSIRAASANGT